MIGTLLLEIYPLISLYMASNIPLEITVTTNTSMRDHLVNGVWKKFEDKKCGYSDEKFDTFFDQEWGDYSDKLKKL